MSVLAYTPRSKRLFEDSENEQQGGDSPSVVKRARCNASPAGLSYGSRLPSSTPWLDGPGSIHPATVAALKGLFPGMDDQTLSSVLAECGSDIDAAIRRLNELRLAANSEQAGAANGVPVPAGPAVAGPANGAAGAPAPQQQQQQQQPPAAPERAGPQTAEQWTDALVAEMAAAKDVPDAKARAAKALTAFEQFVTAHIVAAREREAKDAAGGDRAGASSRLGEVQRENAILKRAVQIQNARIQELSSREAEVAALKQAVGQYQERLKQMELSNYSLALHLSKATGGSGLQPGQRPPDVF